MIQNLAGIRAGNLAGFLALTDSLSALGSGQASRSRRRRRSEKKNQNKTKTRGIHHKNEEGKDNVNTLFLRAFLVARKRVVA